MSDEYYYTDDWGGDSDYTADPEMSYYGDDGDEAWLPTELGGIPLEQLLTYAPEGQGYDGFIQSILAQQETPSVMMPLSAFGPAQSTEQLISNISGVPLSSLTGTQFADLGQAPEQSLWDKGRGLLNSFTEQKTNPYDQVLAQAQADGRNLSPDAWAKLALASAQWEAKQPSAFEQLLKLGLPVVGGLMSYNDAKSRNKAAEAYTDQLKQREANYTALAKKTSLPPGGYAALKVINPVSLAPKLV
jgi:hypothetical protein